MPRSAAAHAPVRRRVVNTPQGPVDVLDIEHRQVVNVRPLSHVHVEPHVTTSGGHGGPITVDVPIEVRPRVRVAGGEGHIESSGEHGRETGERERRPRPEHEEHHKLSEREQHYIADIIMPAHHEMPHEITPETFRETLRDSLWDVRQQIREGISRLCENFGIDLKQLLTPEVMEEFKATRGNPSLRRYEINIMEELTNPDSPARKELEKQLDAASKGIEVNSAKKMFGARGWFGLKSLGNLLISLTHPTDKFIFGYRTPRQRFNSEKKELFRKLMNLKQIRVDQQNNLAPKIESIYETLERRLQELREQGQLNPHTAEDARVEFWQSMSRTLRNYHYWYEYNIGEGPKEKGRVRVIPKELISVHQTPPGHVRPDVSARPR